ncbi:MAG: YkgJ family cysteine cluster protein [Selenomonadaceae bacterium]|nr:YkgJ family cysteine cluster protein [Selenomonadaceae bacterium]
MFPCEKCGACCRHIDDIFFVENMSLPDGTCKFFDKKTNLCTIYSARPLFCNVDAYYEKFFSNIMSREAFYSKNKELCQFMRNFDDISRAQRKIISLKDIPQSLQKKLNGRAFIGKTNFN